MLTNKHFNQKKHKVGWKNRSFKPANVAMRAH